MIQKNEDSEIGKGAFTFNNNNDWSTSATDETCFNAFIGTTDKHYLQNEYDELKNNNNKVWKDTAWKNDVLSSVIVITTFADAISDIHAEISDFINEEIVFDNRNITIRSLKETKAYIGRSFDKPNIPTNHKENIPDIIYKELPVSVDAKTVQPLWVTIDVPTDTPAGDYSGTITLTAKNNEDIILNYSFEVLDITVPEKDHQKDYDFGMELWQYPYTVARYYGINEEDLFGEKHLKILTHQLEMYKKSGGDSITVTIVEDGWNGQTTDKYPSMVKWTKKTDGTFEYNYEHMDAYVDLALGLGVDKEIKSFSMVPWENRIIYFNEELNENITVKPEPGSQEWKDIWNPFMESYVKHLDEKGWFDITYIAMDERPLDQIRSVIELVHSHKNKSGKHLKIFGAMNYSPGKDDILDQIDDISISLGNIDHDSDMIRNLTAHRRELGLTTTMYTMTAQYPNSFTRSDPSESAWTMWYAEAHQLDGFLRWAYDAWVTDPLKDASHFFFETGDVAFIYPNEVGSESIKPYSTPRYERLSEGIRDVRKVRYLKSLHPSLKNKLDELTQSIGRRYGTTNPQGSVESSSKEESEFITSEVNRMHDGLRRITKEYLNSKEVLGDTIELK